MYRWVFQKLPGPTWVKAVVAVMVFLVVVAVLFEFVYPPMHSAFFDNTLE